MYEQHQCCPPPHTWATHLTQVCGGGTRGQHAGQDQEGQHWTTQWFAVSEAVWNQSQYELSKVFLLEVFMWWSNKKLLFCFLFCLILHHSLVNTNTCKDALKGTLQPSPITMTTTVMAVALRSAGQRRELLSGHSRWTVWGPSCDGLSRSSRHTCSFTAGASCSIHTHCRWQIMFTCQSTPGWTCPRVSLLFVFTADNTAMLFLSLS